MLASVVIKTPSYLIDLRKSSTVAYANPNQAMQLDCVSSSRGEGRDGRIMLIFIPNDLAVLQIVDRADGIYRPHCVGEKAQLNQKKCDFQGAQRWLPTKPPRAHPKTKEYQKKEHFLTPQTSYYIPAPFPDNFQLSSLQLFVSVLVVNPNHTLQTGPGGRPPPPFLNTPS
ncbi:agnoprotein [Human mastadenovirus B]|uniref:Agnoprotein n=2 Tax=Human mastadenovirus B TaxID=108098 RepID=T1UG52_9ADEN|nr:DNA binding agnoprotein [Human adenovirus B3]AGT75912.1 agnoprotein [Human mastadenovirus B]AGT76043.1 agnoprotein [Human mastadenovirus B]AGT76085.1 agnoprotein [Human mastadenovirus B]AGT76556.1 agnoprotein [Human mastadenovirus B]